MSSPVVLDIERLLSPIAGDNPCGESLRWDPVYDDIKGARREEDKDALGAEGPVQADWAFVVSKASEALATRSKDIMLAGFLTEALLQLHGFAGLRDGLRVVNGLLENFWDSLYPLPDNDDLEPRAAPIVWFTEADRGARLPNRIRDVALAVSATDGVVPSWSYWKSRYISPKGETEDDSAYERRRLEGEERSKAFENAVAATPLPYYATLREDLDECLQELKRLDGLLDQRFGRAAPGLSALRQSLDECGALVNRIFKDKGGLAAEEAAPAVETESGAPAAGVAGSTGPIRTREDALQRLAEVAAYFRHTEPHSPVSYLVQRATKWGRMPLEDLMQEIIKDSSTREQISELLGFPRRED
jgi:type VI secretion system protein ImpA